MAADVTVRAVLAEGGTLSGEYTTPDNVALVAGNLVLAPKQASPTANDLYRVVAGGPWTRATDVTLSRWMDILVEDGDDYAGKAGWAGSIWTLSTEAPYPRDGSAPLHFEPRQKQPHPSFGGGLSADLGGLVDLVQRTGVEGTYARVGGTLNKYGAFTNVFQTEEGGTYREGLELAWNSATQVSVLPGSAFAPDSGQMELAEEAVLDFPADFALTANTFYYLYLYEENGSVRVEVSPQRPASPYLGRARTKGGGAGGVLDNVNPDTEPDGTRRYIGVVRATNAANAVLRFRHEGDWILYRAEVSVAAVSGGLRIDGALAGTAFGIRDASPRVPPTSRLARVSLVTNAQSGVDINLDETNTTNIVWPAATANSNVSIDVPLSPTQTFHSRNKSASGSTDVAVLGYLMER